MLGVGERGVKSIADGDGETAVTRGKFINGID